MRDQYQILTFVEDYLESLNIHPITVTEALTDENYQKSYQLIKENPQITKEEFLSQMNLEEFED